MKIATHKNLSKSTIRCEVVGNMVRNNFDTLANINQISLFDIKWFNNKKANISVIDGKVFYNDCFFDRYDSGDMLKYEALGGRINFLSNFKLMDFLNNNGNYSYQTTESTDNYIIDFSSDRKFNGTIKIDKITLNLLELSFTNAKAKHNRNEVLPQAIQNM